MIVTDREEFGLPRPQTKIEAHLNGPFHMGFGVLHDPLQVIKVDLDFPGDLPP